MIAKIPIKIQKLGDTRFHRPPCSRHTHDYPSPSSWSCYNCLDFAHFASPREVPFWFPSHAAPVMWHALRVTTFLRKVKVKSTWRFVFHFRLVCHRKQRRICSMKCSCFCALCCCKHKNVFGEPCNVLQYNHWSHKKSIFFYFADWFGIAKGCDKPRTWKWEEGLLSLLVIRNVSPMWWNTCKTQWCRRR